MIVEGGRQLGHCLFRAPVGQNGQVTLEVIVEASGLCLGWISMTQPARFCHIPVAHDPFMCRFHVIDSGGTAVTGDAPKASVVAGQESVFAVVHQNLFPCLQRRQRATSALAFGKALCLLRFFCERLQVFL